MGDVDTERAEPTAAAMIDADAAQAWPWAAAAALSGDGVCFVDAESLRVLECNPALACLVGRSPDELRGISLDALIDAPPTELEELRRLVVEREGCCLGPQRLRDRDDRPVEVEIAAQKARAGSRDVLVLVAREVRRLRDVGGDLLAPLAGGVAHDVNNLVAGMLGNAKLALGRLPETDPARPYVARLEPAARRAAELCRQLLAYSARSAPMVQPLCMSGLVRDVALLLEATFSDRATLVLTLADDPPAFRAEPSEVRQVLLNLVLNAAEALEGRAGRIAIVTGATALDAARLAGCVVGRRRPAGRYVFLEVADDGCGMDPATLRRALEPSYSTKPALGTRRGLGLAAVERIVRAYDGALEVQSAPGRGSTFRAFFPACA